MGQLTNQFVSQSYQGLLNLANANTGLTTNLQTVTDGLGGSSPLQISQTQVNISGTFTVNGAPVSVDTGSLVTTSSFNAYTSSVDLRFDGIELETGSLQNQINGLATTSSLSTLSGSIATTDLSQNNRLTSIEGITGSLATTSSLNSYTLTSSFNSYTSSNDSKVNSLISQTGSYVTETESGSFVTSVTGLTDTITITKGNGSQNSVTINNVQSSSFANNATSASFAQNALSASWAPDNSNRNGLITTGSIGGNQSITGSLDVQGTISATSASFTYVNTIYETASVIYSSGSNQFGDASNDIQTLYGTVVLPNGPLNVTGSVVASGSLHRLIGNTEVTGTLKVTDGISGSLFGTSSYATNALSSSHAIYADTASFAQNVVSSSYAVTSSIAFDVVVYGKCNNTSGLLRGTVVRIVGADGNNPLFDSASWTDDFNSANTLGVLSEDVAHNAFANIVVQGKLIGINTSGFTAGDVMYLSSSGQYTTQSVPAPYHEVRLGQVLRVNQNQGSMYVNIDNGYELTELHDVDITSPAVGDVLTYVSGAYGQWVNKDGSELGYATTGSNTFVGQQTILNDVTINSSNPFGTFVNMISTGTTSFNMNSPLTQFQSNGQMVFTNTLASTGSSDISFLTQNGGDIILNTSNSGSVAITGSVNVSGSNTIIGNQTITGSLNLSGSASITQNLRLFSSASYANTSVQPGAYITQSLPVSASNIIFANASNLGQIPLAATATGSILISGSNNIFFNSNRGNTIAQGTIGYLEGANNIVQAIPVVTTQSFVTPNTPFFNGNFLQAGVNSSNISSSLGGNLISNNNVNALTTLNHNSGSIAVTNNMILASVTSTQNLTPAKNQASLSNNFIVNGIVLTHNSSSISTANNLVGGLIITNDVSSSFTAVNNGIGVNRNIINGNGLVIYTTGSMSSNTQRFFTDNLIVGRANIISSSFIANNNSNLLASAVVGQNLVVSGSHGTNSGGSAFFGRFNDTGSLALSQDIVFAVGTGTGTSNRRTGFWIDSGSFVGVSGSFGVSGSLNVLGNTNLSGSFGVSGSANISGSVNLRGGNITISGSQLITNNFINYNGSPNDPGTMDNFVGHFMVDRNTFVFNNINQSQLSSGSNFAISTNNTSLQTDINFYATYGGKQTAFKVINNNGTRRIELTSDNTYLTGALNVGISNNIGQINTYGGSNWLYRNTDTYNTIIGNVQGLNNGFFAGSEKNMVLNGFFSPFATGSNNVIIQGAGDDFISGSNNIFIGSHNGQAGGSGNLLLGATGYASGSIFNSKFELGTQNDSRIFHKDTGAPLQIGYDTQVTGSLRVSNGATVTGSLNVTGSVTIANAGDLTMYGHKMFNCGEFWSNTTQSGSAGVSGSLNFDASGSAVGVSLVSGSRLTMANAGTYNIQFSAQIEASGGSDTAYVWFKKNGTNIGDSATKVTLPNNTAQVMTVNILDEAVANDYYELGYQFTNGNATILAETASGNIPAIPSVIATVTQAR